MGQDELEIAIQNSLKHEKNTSYTDEYLQPSKSKRTYVRTPYKQTKTCRWDGCKVKYKNAIYKAPYWYSPGCVEKRAEFWKK